MRSPIKRTDMPHPNMAGRNRKAGRSMSEILGDIAVAYSDWARIRLFPGAAFKLPRAGYMTAHFVTRGTLYLSIGHNPKVAITEGDGAIVLDMGGHVLRTENAERPQHLDYFDQAHGLDMPLDITLGDEGRWSPADAFCVLTAHLHVRLPRELSHAVLPSLLLGTRTYRNKDAGRAAVAAMEANASGPGASNCLTRFAEMLLVRELREVLRHNPELLTETDDADRSAMARAVQIIRLEPGRQWSVENLAQYCGMSRAKFAALFKQDTGRSPMDVVNEFRMDMAEKLLRETNTPIKEVAARVGYRSDTSFVRSFSMRFGVPPGAYRKGKQTDTAPPAGQNWFDLFN